MKVWKNKKNKIKIVLQFMEDKLIPDKFFYNNKDNKYNYSQPTENCLQKISLRIAL